MSTDIPRSRLSTGATLLNLALADSPTGGFLPGKYYFLVGDSSSGKTFLSMTCFAEAILNSDFKNHRLIYDNVEDGMLIDLDALFNEQVADRVEPPEQDKDGVGVYSDTVESFYYHLDDAVSQGKPFIYVLDSMDSLTSEQEEEKFEEHKEAYRKGKESKGSYGDGKAKKNSEGIRKAMKGLRTTGSILIVIAQTRDNLGMGFEKKTRSGGRALRFYATAEIWTSIVKRHKKKVNEIDREIGVRVKVDIKKNRMTGKTPEVELDIFPTVGIDDVGSCVEYLVKEGKWAVSNGSINAVELSLSGTKEKLIRKIESKGLEGDLRALVASTWMEVDDACAVRRKNRYALPED